MKRSVVYVIVLAVLCTVAGIGIGLVLERKGVYPDLRQRRQYVARQLRERFREGRPLRHYGQEDKGAFLLERLTERLDLSEEQVQKIKEILEDTRKEIVTARDSFDGSIKEIIEKSHTKIQTVLNPKQQEEFKEMLGEWQKRPAFRGNQGQERPGFGP